MYVCSIFSKLMVRDTLQVSSNLFSSYITLSVPVTFSTRGYTTLPLGHLLDISSLDILHMIKE